jgi:hypothetical protein
MKELQNLISKGMEDLGIRKHKGHVIIIGSLLWFILVQVVVKLY